MSVFRVYIYDWRTTHFSVWSVYANLYAKRTTSSPITPLNKVEYKVKYLHERQQQNTSTSHSSWHFIHFNHLVNGVENRSDANMFHLISNRYITYELFELTLSSIHDHTKRRIVSSTMMKRKLHIKQNKVTVYIVIFRQPYHRCGIYVLALCFQVYTRYTYVGWRYECNLWLCQAVCA